MADLNYTLDDLTSILEGIIRQHGPQVMQLLGQYLQQKTDPSISRYLKTKMGGGLKAVLTARPNIFRISGTAPNEVVSLAQGGPQQARKALTATLKGYIDAVISAINNANFKEIARALKLFGGVQTAALADELLQVKSFEAVTRSVPGRLWPILLSLHFQAFVNWKTREYQNAYSTQESMLVQLKTHFEQVDTATPLDSTFPLSVFNVIVTDLRLMAKWADKGISKHKGGGHALMTSDNMRAAANQMQGLGRFTVDRDNSAFSRKWAVLTIANQIFKISFYLNTINLCGSIQNLLSSRNYPSLSEFPVSQYTTYCFYKGRLDMFSSNYESAETNLRTAFLRCHKQKLKNKRLCLIYLVPVSMLLGRFPAQRLLEKYRLTQFASLATAVKTGDIASYNQNLKEHERFYRAKAIWLTVVRLKTVLYRNFLKRAQSVVKSDKMFLKHLLAALHAFGDIEIDSDEFECIVAGLIASGYVKGYISHRAAVIVLAKQNPFPHTKLPLAAESQN